MVRVVDLRRLLGLSALATPPARWTTAVALGTVLLALFWASGTMSGEDRHPETGSLGAALFFVAIIAYIVPVFAFISQRTAAAIEELAPLLDADAHQQRHWREQVYRKPLAWLLVVLGIGIVAGIAHNLILYGSPERLWTVSTTSLPALSITLGTFAVWLIMTLVISALLDNAGLMARLARQCRIDLLHTYALRPFARVAVISTLAVVGAAAAFPLMFVDDELNPATYLPGLMAIVIPMLIMAGRPIWPLHRRIAEAKRRSLAELNERIRRSPQANPDQPETLASLAPLLAYRREILLVSEWPFDVGVVARLGLYLIIPPLTWVGAALIENVVESFL